MTARRVLMACVLAMGAALSLPARAAEPGQAQALFDQGLADMDAGRFEKACPAIEQSYQLDPSPGTLFTLAECEAKRGRLATAVQHYDEYLALYAKLPREKKAKQGDRERASREAKAALLPQVPEVTVLLPSTMPQGTRVTIDETRLDAASLGSPVRVDPGEHLLTALTPDGAVTDTHVTVGKGEKKTILLELKAARTAAAVPPPAPQPQTPTPPPPAEPQGPSGQRISAFVVGGLGAAGVLIGAITGGMAIAKKSTVDANCGSGIGMADRRACNQTGFDAANSLKTLGLVSTIGLAVGAAGVATGVVVFVTEPKRQRSSARVSVEVTALGVSGAAAGLKGAW